MFWKKKELTELGYWKKQDFLATLIGVAGVFWAVLLGVSVAYFSPVLGVLITATITSYSFAEAMGARDHALLKLKEKSWRYD